MAALSKSLSESQAETSEETMVPIRFFELSKTSSTSSVTFWAAPVSAVVTTGAVQRLREGPEHLEFVHRGRRSQEGERKKVTVTQTWHRTQDRARGGGEGQR